MGKAALTGLDCYFQRVSIIYGVPTGLKMALLLYLFYTGVRNLSALQPCRSGNLSIEMYFPTLQR